ncbi:MAG: PDZ domain-containing protein, partial [Nannocystaceae bacterium]
TDAQGRFTIDGVGQGQGSVTFSMGSRARGAERLANHAFVLEPGERQDLGTIVALPPAGVGKRERGRLGLRTKVSTRPPTPEGQDHPEPTAADADSSLPQVWITWVEAEGPAAVAGLKVGDRVLAVDGIEHGAVGAKTLALALLDERWRAGQSLELKVERAGAPRSVTIEAAVPLEGG